MGKIPDYELEEFRGFGKAGYFKLYRVSARVLEKRSGQREGKGH